MAGRDIQIPFGPDKTGGWGFDAIAPEGEERPLEDAEPLPLAETLPRTMPAPLAETVPDLASAMPTEALPNAAEPEAQPLVSFDELPQTAPVQEPPVSDAAVPVEVEPARQPVGQPQEPQAQPAEAPALWVPSSVASRQQAAADAGAAPEQAREADGEPVPEGEAEPQAMDEIQMSILALKDSIGQGRELKEREKEREELAEALEADYIELADREDILKNYQRIVAEQDAIVADCTQKRDAAKAQIAQLTAGVEQAQAQLDALREQHAMQLQPIESDLGRARAAADQAKNDERSRKSELGAAESELRKAAEGDANTMAAARHQLVQDAYDEAVARSNQAKERLAQVQKAYDDAKQRAEQAQGPLTRNIEDMNAQIEALKEQVNGLGDEISVARNRRQYCDAVYQYPDETAKMRAEVQEAEELARQMDEENDALREQLADSRRKARTAKIAIAVVIILIIIIVVAFVAAAGR